ncbi:MAG: GMC family oxidoreductase [Rhodomicrobiaceae bacterium]
MPIAEAVSDGASFDYVIIGAGSAGCVLAARLSEDPAVSVCLIEAGPPDRHRLIHIPFGLAALAKVKGINWGFLTTQQPAMNGRRMIWPRGKILGGCSSVNAMCYTRGAREDYDDWAEGGAHGWDWASVLPYFRKSEDYEHGENAYHGMGGPLTVSDLRHVSPLSSAFVRAGQEIQLRRNPDFNGETQDGVGIYHVTQRDGRRCSTATAYLRPNLDRPNLTIVTDCLAERIIVEDRQAKGVRLTQKSGPATIRATREVLLCGGAVNSPQLLMLSGIGPAAHLKEHGIEPVADRPGVGRNLQDHLDAIVQMKTHSRDGYGIAFRAVPQTVSAAVKYMRGRRGHFTSNVAEAGGFVTVTPGERLPDVQFHFLPVRIKDHGGTNVYGFGYSVHVCCLQPKSRGEIRLRSADPAAHPAIDPRYLSEEEDGRVIVAGLKLARRILGAPAFAAYRGVEVEPGPDVQSDEDLLAFIRERGETIYHPVGTCRMGASGDPATVVDPELKVIGVDGLRVVDASVMPKLIRGNTNAPTIMIAERAADLIRGRPTL